MNSFDCGRTGRATAWAGVIGWLVLALASSPAVAQKMYRCGSVYQDHACSGDQVGKVLGQSAAASPEAAPVVDAVCAARGARAQKISWAREAGRTQEQQLAAAPQDRALINEVYNQRGSSVVIRTAVETACMAAKDRASEAAALEEAAARLRGDAPAPVLARAAPPQVPADDAAQRRAEAAAISKKIKCGSIANSIRSIHDLQRVGGSGTAMDRLDQQLQEMNSEASDAGC